MSADQGRTSGYFEIPGIGHADGSPDPFPFDPEEWRSWFGRVLAHRVRVADLCARGDQVGLQARAAQRALCQQPGGIGHAYWLLTFCFIVEPRNDTDQVILPFILHPRQLELLLTIHETMATPRGAQASLAVEKAREVGATWIDISHHAWCWTFDGFYTGALISKTEDEVDNDSVRSMMWKLDFILGRHLRTIGNRYPQWLLPKGFVWAKALGKLRRHLGLKNPETGAEIIGLSSTDDAGRSLRMKKFTIDECCFNPFFGTIWNANAATTHHRFGYSSAGVDPPDFYHLVKGRKGYIKPRVFRFEYHQFIGHDAAWLASKREEMREDEFRSEVLIEYLAGSGLWVYPDAKDLHTGWYPWDGGKGWLTTGAIDDGAEGTALGVFQKEAGTQWRRLCGGILVVGRTMHQIGCLMTGELDNSCRWSPREIDWARWAKQSNLKLARWVGCRHGDQKNQITGTSPYQELLNEFGLWVDTERDPEQQADQYRIDRTRELLPWLHIHERNGAPEVLEALQLRHYPKRREGSQATTPIKAPVHDELSHYVTMVEYYIIGDPIVTAATKQARRDPLPLNIGDDEPKALSAGRFSNRSPVQQIARVTP